MFCCIKTSFLGSKIARLCKHDKCEHKKMLNLCIQDKISTAYCNFIPKCRSWRIVDAVKDKTEKDQNKNNESKQKTTTKNKISLTSWDSNHDHLRRKRES